MTREEAIEVYNGLINEKIKEAFEFFAPELAESEDERIRTRLSEYFRGFLEGNEHCYEDGGYVRWEGLDVKSILAWLEKQKDASKAIEAVDRIDKYIDKHVANAHDMKDSNPDKKYYRGWDDALGKMAGILQDVYSGEKQKEQKPAEWSEEEKQKLNRIYSIIGWAMDEHAFSSCKKLIGDKEGVELQDFLRSIANPNQEWSEEDEKMLKCCLIAINHYEKTCNIGDHLPTKFNIDGYLVSVDKVKSWLKSFRPQPRQEWSEEDERHIKSITRTIERYKENDPASAERVLGYCDDDIAWLKSLLRKNR